MNSRDIENYLRDKAVDGGVPISHTNTLIDYVVNGHQPDEFLNCLIEGKLIDTVIMADFINVKMLKEYVYFLFMHTPRECYGSTDNYYDWLMKKEYREEILEKHYKYRVSHNKEWMVGC